jgi:hypothetical protein
MFFFLNCTRNHTIINTKDDNISLLFPNYKAISFRSILTVPWMEMGGQTTITCAKTGYNANIHFHCKVSISSKSSDINICRLGVTSANKISPFQQFSSYYCNFEC